jgi:hypothetical protein
MNLDRYILNVYGTQGSGKSYLTKRLVGQMQGRVFILDTMGEYDLGMILTAQDTPEGTKTASEVLRRQLLLESKGRAQTPPAYVVRTERRALAEKTIDQFFQIMDRAQPAGHWVIDEASKFMDARKGSREEIARAIDYGRHARQNLVFVARRPTQLHTDARANATALVSFQQQYGGDRKKLANFDPKGAARVETLDYSEHEYAILGTGQHQLPFYDWLRSRSECAYFNDPRKEAA